MSIRQSVMGCANYGATTVNLSTSLGHTAAIPQDPLTIADTWRERDGSLSLCRTGYVRVDVSATSLRSQKQAVTSCPTGADERENFANWFSSPAPGY